MWMVTYLITLCHTLLLFLSMDTCLLMRILFPRFEHSHAIIRGGTVPDFRRLTNIRVAPFWGHLW